MANPKNKLRCTVSGEWYGVSAARRRKLVEKYGSDDELVKNYVSRTSRRYLKEGYTPERIRQMTEQGEITTKTSAPKRLGKETVKNDPVTEMIKAEPDDPEVKAFMENPAGDASDKAV